MHIFFMCNYKLKISITWSTIYAVTALSKEAIPCLIQVENSAFGFLFSFFNSFSLTSFVRFSLSLLLGKWSGNSFLNYESQVLKLLVASTSWLLTINRAVKMNPQDWTSGGQGTDTQIGKPQPSFHWEFQLSSKTLPLKYKSGHLLVCYLQVTSGLSSSS